MSLIQEDISRATSYDGRYGKSVRYLSMMILVLVPYYVMWAVGFKVSGCLVPKRPTRGAEHQGLGAPGRFVDLLAFRYCIYSTSLPKMCDERTILYMLRIQICGDRSLITFKL